MHVLELNDVGIDFAIMPDPDGYAGIQKNRAKFVFRYSAGAAFIEGGTAFVDRKCCHVDEIDHAVTHEMDFIGNFELSESTPTEGRASGLRHGAADKRFWDSRGLHPKAGVTVSWEPGTDRSLWPAVANFLEGYREGSQRLIGMYAGLPTLLHFRDVVKLLDFTHMPMSTFANGLPEVLDSEKPALLEKAARDNGINMCQNFKRWYPPAGADEDIYTTEPQIAFSHLQAKTGWTPGGDMALDLSDAKTVWGADVLGAPQWETDPVTNPAWTPEKYFRALANHIAGLETDLGKVADGLAVVQSKVNQDLILDKAQPTLDEIKAVVAAGGDPNAVAQAVLDLLRSKLNA